MRFPWGFDEEDEGCNALKLALAQRIMELRQQGVTPQEEQATKWAPYLRERYFWLLADCTIMEAVSLHRTLDCEYDAYRKIIDYADMVLAVYDPATARGDAVDRVMEYDAERGLPVIRI